MDFVWERDFFSGGWWNGLREEIEAKDVFERNELTILCDSRRVFGNESICD